MRVSKSAIHYMNEGVSEEEIHASLKREKCTVSVSSQRRGRFKVDLLRGRVANAVKPNASGLYCDHSCDQPAHKQRIKSGFVDSHYVIPTSAFSPQRKLALRRRNRLQSTSERRGRKVTERSTEIEKRIWSQICLLHKTHDITVPTGGTKAERLMSCTCK